MYMGGKGDKRWRSRSSCGNSSLRILDPHLTLELKREICEKFKSLLMAHCMHRGGGPQCMRSSSYSVRNVAVDNTPSFEEFQTLVGKTVTVRFFRNSYEMLFLQFLRGRRLLVLPSLLVPLPSLVWCSSDVSLFHGKWLSGTGTPTKSRQTHNPLIFFAPEWPHFLPRALWNSVGVSDQNYHNLS